MNKDIKVSLAVAFGLIGASLAVTAARKAGYIEVETAMRIIMAAVGLMLAWYGNRAPKAFVPNAHVRQINRVAGWSMAVSGLTNAAFWAFAPLPMAMTLGTGVIAAGLAVTLIYSLKLRGRARACD